MLREVHCIPKVDTTLAELNGATMSSKLDGNSGLWQISLATKSTVLINFFTPYGQFCFNKLPFGICSVPEVLQCQMTQGQI